MASNIQKSTPETVYEAIAKDTGCDIDRIKSFMESKGIKDPSELVGDDSLLVELMEGNSALQVAPTETKAPAKRGRKPKRTNQATDFSATIAHVAQQSAEEVNAFTEVLRQGKAEWVGHTANSIVDELRSAPNEVVQAVASIAMEEQADADFFRGEATKLCSGLFAIR